MASFGGLHQDPRGSYRKPGIMGRRMAEVQATFACLTCLNCTCLELLFLYVFLAQFWHSLLKL